MGFSEAAEAEGACALCQRVAKGLAHLPYRFVLAICGGEMGCCGGSSCCRNLLRGTPSLVRFEAVLLEHVRLCFSYISFN